MRLYVAGDLFTYSLCVGGRSRQTMVDVSMHHPMLLTPTQGAGDLSESIQGE